MCNNCSRLELHLHTHYSNLRLLDCINTEEDVILKAAELGLKGVAITDHESLSGHLKAIKAVENFKKEGKIPQDFKLILGNEIYLVESLEEVRENYKSGVTKFPHFILLAKNKNGHEALRKLSSQAWENSFYTGTMERVPTEMSYLEKIAKEYPNTLIASSACLGSPTSIYILAREEAKLNEDKESYEYYNKKLHEFIQWCISVFGKDDFYLELQPSGDYEQRIVNLNLIELSKEYGLELIITNDVHYLRPEDRQIHKAYLNSQEDERETDSFYAHTYLHKNDEIFNKLDYIDKEIIHRAFENTLKIGEKCEEYTLEAQTVIPKTKLPEFEVMHLFKQGYGQYPYIAKMANSEHEQDKYLLHLIEKGFIEQIPYKNISKEYFHEILSRINVELEQLWLISEKVKQRMSAYYVTVSHIVNLIWGDDCGDNSRYEGSLLGSGRGSAVAFLINYLIGITQVNPLAYGIEVPYWRHLNKDRTIADLDIDLDVVSTKKPFIFKRLRESFGERQVLQICTFGTEKSKSAIQTACRGLGIDNDTGQYLASFIPFERGELWSLNDCLYGNEELGRKPIKEFIEEIEKYPLLKETALKIEGLINKRSIHAGGVLVLDEDYTKRNAMMRAPNGTPITQFNLEDTQAMGGIKFDLLTVEGLDKIQTALELLLDEGVIEWQGTLRKTFNKYLHPEIIDKTSPEIYEMISKSYIPDLFQFSTQIAQSAIHKAKPKNLIELLSINSLIRLMVTDGEEQPIDTFIKFKNNIDLWYQEMRDFGLNDEEIKTFEKHLLKLNGVADTQESIMLMAMDENIGNCSLAIANDLRKGIAKKNRKKTEETMKKIYDSALKRGNRKVVVDYLWHQIQRMILYSFSIPHVLAYTLIAMEQIYLNYKYDPLYWNTAVLTVNSGSQEVEEEQKKKSTNYGKVAEAIGKMKSYGVNVALPDINKAGFSFVPDIENNQIIYSLKGIVGINDETVHKIIENRPYSSFEDFYKRVYEKGLITQSQMLQLIKAGCFNSFDNPIEIMKQFILKMVDVKDSLNMQNMKSIIRLGLLDTPELSIYKQYFNFKEYIGKKAIRATTNPKDRILLLDEYSYNFYMSHFSGEAIINGFEISEKKFKKEYDLAMKPFKEIISTKDFIRKYNIAQFYELWDKYAQGTVPKWEMESVSYYSNEHELDAANLDLYGVVNYFDLPEEPEIVGYNNYNGNKTPKYKIYSIAGTVLDRDKNKHTFTLLTKEGVVTCKTYAGAFSHYDKNISRMVSKDKKEIIEKSWFSRGNLLLVRGFRRGDQFVLRTYAEKGMAKPHTINLIKEIKEDGALILQSERTKI